MRILRNHEWKGGIRELENVIERALILAEGDYISKDDLPPNMVENALENEMPERLKEAAATFEKEHIQKILRRTSMNKEVAASILGISLYSLYLCIGTTSLNNLSISITSVPFVPLATCLKSYMKHRNLWFSIPFE